jgi:DNA ligase 1
MLTDNLVSLFKRTPSNIIDKVIYLIQDKLHPDYEWIELGIAEKMALRALSQSSGADMQSILQLYHQTGDLGDTARKIIGSKNQGNVTLFSKSKMTVEHVYATLDKIARTTGTGNDYTSQLLLRHYQATFS